MHKGYDSHSVCVSITVCYSCYIRIPYSQKYWQELNLAVKPKIAIVTVLADLTWRFGTGSPYVILYMGV